MRQIITCGKESLIRVAGEYCWVITILVRPIGFKCAGVWFSAGFPMYIRVYFTTYIFDNMSTPF